MNKETFICKKCSKETSRTELTSKGWLVCQVCVKVYQKEYRSKNKHKAQPYQKQYRIENAETISKQRKSYREANKEALNAKNRENWKVKGKKYSASHYKWKVKKLKEDLNFRLQETIRARFTIAIKNNAKKGSAIKLLGCSIEELKTYLESKFQPGMTWENWTLKGWHIDHIIPLSKANLNDEKELAAVCHYTNLQPLWAVDNIRKSNKY